MTKEQQIKELELQQDYKNIKEQLNFVSDTSYEKILGLEEENKELQEENKKLKDEILLALDLVKVYQGKGYKEGEKHLFKRATLASKLFKQELK